MISENTKLLISLGCTWDYIPLPFFESYIQIATSLHKNKIPYAVGFSTRGRQDDLRNNSINTVLRDHQSYSHILFLDIDHRFPKDTIIKLLSHNKSIVSGLSFKRTEPYNPVIFNWDNEIEEYVNIIEWKNELFEVDATGGACLLVETEVFKKMKFPWFEFYTGFDRSNRKISISEDLYFCKKAKELGYSIFIDPTCTNDHLGIINVNKQTWENYNNGRI